MSHQQPTIADLLSSEIIKGLTRPSDQRYGQAIHDRGGVEFIVFTPSQVEAWVGGLDGKGANAVARNSLLHRRDSRSIAPETPKITKSFVSIVWPWR